MSSMKCFDVASIVIEEAKEKFSPQWKIDDENLDIFRKCCEAIDKLSEENSGISFDITIDETTKRITVILECVMFTAETPSHVFYRLIKRAVSYSFSTSEEGNLLITFVFPSLWGKD